MTGQQEEQQMLFHRKDDREVLKLRQAPCGKGQKLPLLYYPLLEKTGIVRHAFTTRAGGCSSGMFSSLNLSFTRGDEEACVRENYRRLAVALEVPVESFVFSDQTHTSHVKRVTAEDAGNGIVRENRFHDIDGLITSEEGVTLITFYADCVPLYFVDPVHRAIGLSHSGWRGTVARMGRETLHAMEREFGTQPSDVICAVGPSICQDCYEVSRDVAEQFMAEFQPQQIPQILQQKENDKFQLDLWKANEIILTEAGILPEHLAVTNICTCCNPGILFSHRASHGKRGNLAAVLALKP